MNARLPLAVSILALVSSLRPPAARACMQGMDDCPPAAPTTANQPPARAPAPAPIHLAATTALLTSANQKLGFSALDLNDANWADRERTLKTLDAMSGAAAQTSDPKWRSIAVATVNGLKTDIAADQDFRTPPSELKKIPDMLTIQLQRDSFLNGRDPASLSTHDQAIYKDLENRYDAAMPESAPTTATPQKDLNKNGGVSGATQKVPGAPEGKPLMTRFHDAYGTAVTSYEGPPVGPTPTPTPAPSPLPGPGGTTPNGRGGSGRWGGLPPPGHIATMLRNDPGNGDAWRISADAKMAGGDFSGALSDAQKAVDLGGGAAARVALGQAKYGLGDYPGANADAKTVLETEPGNPGATALLHFTDGLSPQSGPHSADGGGGANAAAGTSGGSGAVELGGVAASQESAAELAGQAKNSLRLGDLDGAQALLTRALALDGGNAELYALRAAAAFRQRDYASAAAAAKAGLALAPKNSALLTTLGLAQLRGKNYKDALTSADELLAQNPGDAYAYALRGHSYGSMGDRDAMMSDLKRAAELDPRFTSALALAGAAQIPTDKDMLFLFPGEKAPGAGAASAPASVGRGRRFGLLVGVAALGGLLLALGLLQTVLAPLKTQVASAFTRLTGPAAAAARESATASPASVNGLLPGLIRGQYEIKRQIGAGGMGTVFEGTDRSLSRRVAIKKMRDELRVNPRDRERFVIEAKTVAALHHPNIVDIYAIAEEGQDVFLVFEYVDGKTVHDLVQGAGRLPISEAARVTRAAADALGYAHARGVVHRDMKPSNMMIDASGRVKVMDFGIARMAKDAMTRYSMTNTVVGTPPYMAPEQEQGHVRRESDVYALAVCAYEMLTGKLPFIGLGAGMLMNKINMSYVPPSRATAGLPEPLDAVFAKAFQADPEQRYRTPKEFADALDSALPASVRA